MSYSKNTIYSTVIQCNYEKDFHHHITTNINTINELKFPNFFFRIVDYEKSKIIQIFLDLIVLYNNTQKFNIPLSILIPIKFPYQPPIFNVVLKAKNTIYNQQNQDIDQKTGKMLVKSLIKWDFSLSLYDVIKEISISLNKVFPILQAPPGYVSDVNTNNNVKNENQRNSENLNRTSDSNCKLN